MRFFLVVNCFLLISSITFSQLEDYSFGEGFRYKSKDNSFYIKTAFRFQLLSQFDWNVANDDLSKIGNQESNFLIRRSRFKFDGYALSPQLKYKFEVGLSNSDVNINNPNYFGNGSNYILDAYIDWNFFKGFTLRAGQAKLPGNRERVISSAEMQLVDRSILNNRFTLDRDVGIGLIYERLLGKQFGLKLIGTFSQGEGRNVIAGNRGGYEYTFRTEFLPFGKFHNKGDYVGSAIYREEKPKLSVGITYDFNERAGRTNGNLGSFIEQNARLESLHSVFVDFMFNYQGLSLMGEYVIRETADGTSAYRDALTGDILGNYYTGTALNLQGGWMFDNNVEFSGRYAHVRPGDDSVGFNQDNFLLGLSKFIVGHQLKVQTDVGYLHRATADDGLMWRLQFELHL